MSQSSTLFTVGTLLRHAQDAGAPVRVLVEGYWIDGVIVGADGLGVIIDSGDNNQTLVRLDSVVAVSFSRAAIDGEPAPPAAHTHDEPRVHWAHQREPIEAGPVGR